MTDDRSAAGDFAGDDAAFRRAVRQRDAGAWARLVKLYGRLLRRQASRLLPASMDPENAVAEVWFRAILNVSRYDAARSPLPWLARICTNVCLDARRGRRGRRPEALETSHAAKDQAPAEDPHAQREAFRQALATLPERDRVIVTLRHLFGLTAAEIAVLLGLAVNTVGKILVRGIERLKTGPAAVALAEWAEVGGLEGIEEFVP
jgi:RNA polymerase sigma-70 factor (ECF subfamily)